MFERNMATNTIAELVETGSPCLGVLRSDMGVPRSNASPVFPTTHWSVVLRARGNDGAEVRTALAALCETYWLPLYAYARRLGQGHEEARDLTQGFVAGLLARGGIPNADPDKGRFRCYVGTAFKRYIQSEWARAHAQKRGGFRPIVPLDAMTEAESESWLGPSGGVSATEVFDAQWAAQVSSVALTRLEQQYDRSGKGLLFRELRGYLDGSKDPRNYPETARALGMKPGAVATAVSRLLARFRSMLRDVVSETLPEGEDVDDEIQYLARCLGRT